MLKWMEQKGTELRLDSISLFFLKNKIKSETCLAIVNWHVYLCAALRLNNNAFALSTSLFFIQSQCVNM